MIIAIKIDEIQRKTLYIISRMLYLKFDTFWTVFLFIDDTSSDINIFTRFWS